MVNPGALPPDSGPGDFSSIPGLKGTEGAAITGKVKNSPPPPNQDSKVETSDRSNETKSARTFDAAKPSVEEPTHMRAALKVIGAEIPEEADPTKPLGVKDLPFFSQVRSMAKDEFASILMTLDPETRKLVLGAIALDSEAADFSSLLSSAGEEEVDVDFEDAIASFQEIPDGSKNQYRFAGSFMQNIAEAKALVSAIKGMMQSQEEMETVDKQISEIADLKGKLEVVKERIKELQELRDKLNDSGFGIDSLSGWQMALMITGIALLVIAIIVIIIIAIVLIVVAAIFAAVAAIVATLVIAVLVALPALIGIGLASAEVAGADPFLSITQMFGGPEENSWITQVVLGVLITVFTLGIGAPIGAVWIARGIEKKEYFEDVENRSEANESIGDLGQLEQYKHNIRQSLALARTELKDMLDIDEEELEFHAGIAALLAMLTQMITSMEAMGFDGPPTEGGPAPQGEGVDAPTKIGQFAGVENASAAVGNVDVAAMLSRLEQAVAKLKSFVADYKEDPEKARQESGDILIQFMAVAMASNEAMLYAHSKEYKNNEVNLAVYNAIFSAMAAVDPAFEDAETRKKYWQALSDDSNRIQEEVARTYGRIKTSEEDSTDTYSGMVSSA